MSRMAAYLCSWSPVSPYCWASELTFCASAALYETLTEIGPVLGGGVVTGVSGGPFTATTKPMIATPFRTGRPGRC